MRVIEKDPLFYKIVRPVISLLFKILYRPIIIGKENIPNKGRIVIAGNHTNNFDCVLLICSTNRCIHFLAKDELYRGIKKVLFKHMGIIPVNRRTKDSFALAKAKSFLNKEMAIGIFPEGTFNRSDKVILPFKIGAVKMAHDTNSKIVPFTITGKYKLFKKSVKITFYKPITIKGDNLDEANEDLMKFISKKLTSSEV